VNEVGFAQEIGRLYSDRVTHNQTDGFFIKVDNCHTRYSIFIAPFFI